MLAGAAVAAILVITGIVIVSSDSSSGPAQAGDTVRGYLEALARGDAEAALSYAINPPPDKTLLTDDILKKQIEKSPIGDIRIVESSPTGKVHVMVTFGDNVVDDTLYLKQDGDGGAWKMESIALPVDFQKDKAAEGSALIDAITLFGEPIAKSGRPYVFPGPVEFGTSNPNIEVDVVNPVFLLSNLQWGVNANYNFAVSEAGKDAVKKAMMPVVVECAKSQLLSPPNCPQQAEIPGMVEGIATWTAPSTLDDVDFVSGIAKDGRQTLTGTISFTLTLQATNPLRNVNNAPRSYGFRGYADMTKQPPVFTFYTGSR